MENEAEKSQESNHEGVFGTGQGLRTETKQMPTSMEMFSNEPCPCVWTDEVIAACIVKTTGFAC